MYTIILAVTLSLVRPVAGGVIDNTPYELKKVTAKMCDLIGISEATIIIQLQNKPVYFNGVKLNAQLIPKNDNLFFILVEADLDRIDVIRIICHELIHVKQIMDGKLKYLDAERIIWKGDTVMVKRKNYESLPHEKEAHALDDIVFQNISKHF